MGREVGLGGGCMGCGWVNLGAEAELWGAWGGFQLICGWVNLWVGGRAGWDYWGI